MERTVTKEEVIEMLGSIPNAARFFGIAQQAIYQWPNFELIPELREAQLRLNHPELFNTK